MIPILASVVVVGSILVILALILAIISLVKPQPQGQLLAVAVILLSAALLASAYVK